MCYSDSDDPSDTVTGDEEYGSYYSSIRNEEIYQDLCVMRRLLGMRSMGVTIQVSATRRFTRISVRWGDLQSHR